MRRHQRRNELKRTLLDDAIDLEQGLSARLHSLGILHDLTWNTDGESPQIDLRVYHLSGNPEQDLEIRITLGTRMCRRLQTFVEESLATVDRGIRVYLEVCSSLHHDLGSLVDRVALSIRELAHRFQDFGPDRLIGVRVYASQRRPRLERIDLPRRAHMNFGGAT